jgi:hypothetical protein
MSLFALRHSLKTPLRRLFSYSPVAAVSSPPCPITKIQNIYLDYFKWFSVKKITFPNGGMGKFRQKRPWHVASVGVPAGLDSWAEEAAWLFRTIRSQPAFKAKEVLSLCKASARPISNRI